MGHSDQVAALIQPALGILAAGRKRCSATGLLRPASEQASGTALTALYAGALDAAGSLCTAAGETESAARCQEELGEVRRALQALWAPRQGLFGEQPPASAGEDRVRTSRYANALLLYFGLADPGQAKEVAGRIAGADGLGADDLLAAFFVAGALWRAGEAARALEWVERRWGGLVDRPGLTWGEKAMSPASRSALEGAAPTDALDLARSPDVPWLATGRSAPRATGPGAATSAAGLPESSRLGPELLPGPDYFLGSQVLGISPGAPGFGVLHIRPQPAGLERAGGRIPTPRGPVQIQWQAEEDRFAFRVDLAEPGETHLFAPRLGQRFPTVGLNGETVWRNEKVHPNPFVQEVISAEDHVVLVVRGKGSYEVVVTT